MLISKTCISVLHFMEKLLLLLAFNKHVTTMVQSNNFPIIYFISYLYVLNLVAHISYTV